MTDRKILNAVCDTAPSAASDGTNIRHLPDELTLTIDGVVYRVHSIFGEKNRMDELLDLATMENIQRCA